MILAYLFSDLLLLTYTKRVLETKKKWNYIGQISHIEILSSPNHFNRFIRGIAKKTDEEKPKYFKVVLPEFKGLWDLFKRRNVVPVLIAKQLEHCEREMVEFKDDKFIVVEGKNKDLLCDGVYHVRFMDGITYRAQRIGGIWELNDAATWKERIPEDEIFSPLRFFPDARITN